MPATAFEYGICQLKDLQLPGELPPTSRHVEIPMTLDGRPVRASKRFWHSVQLRFGFTSNIFRYFSHMEVFRRISEKSADDSVRWCLEHDRDEKTPRLLAVSNPKTGFIEHDDLQGLLADHCAKEAKYHDGLVRSLHAPKHASPFIISGDGFESQYVIETPIDGFGKPAIYLALQRQVCTNGAVAMTPAFRSEINVGRGGVNAGFALTRAIEGFNNEEGFLALRQRFESAGRSWASVHEANRLGKLLVGLMHGKELPGRLRVRGGDGASLTDGSPVLTAFHKMTGDMTGIYGLANLDALSSKKQRTLPAGCKVYDLLNFASELATHHSKPGGGRRLQGYIGELVSGEYDLENTADQFTDWRDFFLADSAPKAKTRRR